MKLTSEELQEMAQDYNPDSAWIPSRRAVRVLLAHSAALEQDIAALKAKSQQRKEALERVQFDYRTEKGRYCIRCFEPKTRGCLPHCIIKLALED